MSKLTAFVEKALHYHKHPSPGKISVNVTKSTNTQEDLSLAYSPGVAHPVLAIADRPASAYDFTAKGNLVAVISNGSAVLGLGNVGALASKPVMEGKAVLFKRFADIDVFDIEVDCQDPSRFVDTVAHIAPTFGGINLEDIKAPECFEIERALSEKLNIPVFHDDQHGTAIVVAAGLLNALELKNKTLSDAVIVCVGAGAAGIASMDLLIKLGARRENIYMIDRQGVIHTGRENLGPYKQAFANHTDKRTLADAVKGADIFMGLSGPDLLTPEMLLSMADHPIVFALSNPDPEINPELALKTRDDIIMATGRSDYPNQVNNVLGFPFIFRGALDVRAHKINTPMREAAVEAIRSLVHEPIPDVVLDAYPNLRNNLAKDGKHFSPDYILPTPLDPRLRERVSSAVAKAAIESGVAGITDIVINDAN